jgi:hypothetical protein
VMIYPASNSTGSGNSSSGNAISKPIFTTADTAAVIAAVTYDTMRARLTAVSARPLQDGARLGSSSWGANACSNAAISQSYPGPTTVDTAALNSEYCASRAGTPDAGAAVYSSCPNRTNYSCGFASSGGFVRNSASMISNVGLWAGVGYLYEDIDHSSTQQGSGYGASYRLIAGGDSDAPSSDAAVPGYRNANSARSNAYAGIGARGATADVSN